jgi:hypothetical protein
MLKICLFKSSLKAWEESCVEGLCGSPAYMVLPAELEALKREYFEAGRYSCCYYAYRREPVKDPRFDEYESTKK